MQLYLFFADDAVGPESNNELYGKYRSRKRKVIC